MIKQIVVNTKHQNKGYGSALISNSIKQLTNDVNAFLCLAWVKEGVIPIKKALIKNLFTQQKTIPNYWKENSVKENYNCTVCGNPLCMCNAAVFLLKKD